MSPEHKRDGTGQHPKGVSLCPDAGTKEKGYEMNQFDEIKAEAIKMVRIANRLRRAEAQMREERGERRELVVKPFKFSDQPLVGRGEPRPTDSAHRAFEEALRFWAMRVANVITERQWQEMVEAVEEAVPDFKGDVIRFFENRFEMLELKDGARIVA